MLRLRSDKEINLQVVEFLLQCGFSVSNRNNEGKTPLHTASIKVIITITINNEGDARRRMRWECQEKVLS